MWTSILRLDPRRVLLTRLLGLLYPESYYARWAPLQVENLPRQALPATNWVRVRNRLAGICGSDLHLIHADGDLRIAPAALPGHRLSYPGHEVVGEVLEIGDDVQRLRVGDRVVLQCGPNCLSRDIQPPCYACAAGNYNLCAYGNLPGPHPFGGGWSEEMLLHEQQLFVVPNELNDEQGVMLEPTAVALHAALRRLPQAGERVLIIGAGTIGLLMLQIVRALVPQAEVHVLARHAFQVERATRMGAARIIYPQHPYVDIQQATKARLVRGLFNNQMLLGGYDVVYDTVGQQHTIHHALRWTRAQGTFVLVGLSLHLLHLDLSPLWYREINVLGSTSHGMESWPVGGMQRRSTLSIAAELMAQGRISPEQLITHRFALTNYKEALIAASRKGNSHAIKVVFDYALLPASVVPTVRAAGQQRRPTGAQRTSEQIAVPEEDNDFLSLPRHPAQEPLVRLLDKTPEDDEDQTRVNTAVAIPVVKLRHRVPEMPVTKPQAETAQQETAEVADAPVDEAEIPTIRFSRSVISPHLAQQDASVSSSDVPETPALFHEVSILPSADEQGSTSQPEPLEPHEVHRVKDEPGPLEDTVATVDEDAVISSNEFDNASRVHLAASEEPSATEDGVELAGQADESENATDTGVASTPETRTSSLALSDMAREDSLPPVEETQQELAPGTGETASPDQQASDEDDVAIASSEEEGPIIQPQPQGAETDDVVAIIPEHDETPTVQVTPKPRSRRKKHIPPT